jgi:nucleoid-associated protein YgaU
VYDAYSPRVRPTSSIGFKIGYGMRFGRLRTPGRYRKLTRQKAIDLGIIYPDGYLTPMAVERHYHVVFAKRDPKTGVVIREVAVGRPGTSPPAKPAPVVAAKPASVKPAPVVAKPVAAAAKPAPKPAAPAPVKPVVAAAKPAVVQPKPAAPAPVKPVVAAPKPAPAVAKPAAKPRGMFEMNFGSASKSAANKPKPASGGLVNIDLGGSKSVITAPKAGTAAPINYAWVSGDSLTALAEAFYGDQNLYPILVDANESKLVSPQNLKPGRALLIPRGVDDVTKAKAREKSNLPHYLPWKKAGK